MKTRGTGPGRRRWNTLAVVGALFLCVAWASVGSPPAEPHGETAAAIPGISPSRVAGGVFVNLDPDFRRAAYSARLRSLIIGGTWFLPEFRVKALPLAPADVKGLKHPSGATVTWIGHSTLLVQLDGVNFLTDPHWGDRSGPFGGSSASGATRRPAIAFEDLPRIDFVLISHDHYDHLDEPTVRRLARDLRPALRRAARASRPGSPTAGSPTSSSWTGARRRP